MGWLPPPPQPQPPPSPRSIPTERDTRCGVCSRPAILLTWVDGHALVERDCQGMRVPHACPATAVDRWERRHNVVLRALGLVNRPEEVP